MGRRQYKAAFAFLLVLVGFAGYNVTQSQTVHRKLYYDGFDADGNPHFVCQSCGLDFLDTRISQVKANLQIVKDFNGLATFKCPHCGAEYQLYIAVHKHEDGSFAVCIQRSDAEGAGGIPESWWTAETP